jgi:hypothetical protein
MPATGKVTETRIGNDIVVSDESGESYVFAARSRRPLLLDIDPRIDLTKPIYEQVAELAAIDEAAEENAVQRPPQDRVA